MSFFCISNVDFFASFESQIIQSAISSFLYIWYVHVSSFDFPGPQDRFIGVFLQNANCLFLIFSFYHVYSVKGVLKAWF